MTQISEVVLHQGILNAIKAVKDQNDYDNLVEKWNMSEAPKEIKDEAKRELNLQKSKFCKVSKIATAEQQQKIKEESADIDDIGN
jgi:hypothetical protein